MAAKTFPNGKTHFGFLTARLKNNKKKWNNNLFITVIK